MSLRRFASPRDGAPNCGRQEPRCPGGELVTYDCHDIETEISRGPGALEQCLDGDRTQATIALDDPRWPNQCSCGYVFADVDMKQECHTRLYRRTDTSELVTIGDAPAGALYDSGTFNDVDGYQRNEDGISIVCKTPAGDWLIDGPSSHRRPDGTWERTGSGWSRSGTLPDISVSPSIAIGDPTRFHAVLTDGWLEVDLP